VFNSFEIQQKGSLLKMPRSSYVQAVRAKIGSDLLMLQSVTVMLFDDQRRLLLAQDASSGLWMTVGGGIDPDEIPADAAVRECWEETGLLIEPTALLGVFGGPEFRINYANGDSVSYVVTVFKARWIAGEACPDGLESSAVRFVSRDEARTLRMAAWTKEMVERAFDYNGTPYFARPTWQPHRKA
jgi:8-oxo-dGTP pyrophosphatase MutT (NUDIX family)